tara:strand:- start:2727 stop:3419 length:693 start_codon:yes stop_codon:yes gene_type:complete
MVFVNAIIAFMPLLFQSVFTHNYKLMKHRILTMLVLVVALIITTMPRSFGQEQEIAQEEEPKNDLRSQWAELLKSSETYLDKKIIRITSLSEYRNVLGDSLTSYTNSIESLKAEKSKIELETSALKSELETVKAELAASEKLNDNMSFFGILLSKSVYSIIVWSIVALLVVVIMLMYGRVKKVAQSTKRVKASFTQVSEDFRAYQFEAKENQIKLKRELQTALNKLELNR